MKVKRNPFERLPPLAHDHLNVPLIGIVRPAPPDDHAGDYDIGELVSNFPEPEAQSLSLEVMDHAMKSWGILKGDYITIDTHAVPRDGDIVVVRLGERFYIRRLYRQNSFIRLETHAESASPLVIEPDTPGFQVLGTVRSVYRSL